MLLITVPIFLAGCIQVGGNNDFGGVFKSADKAVTFQQKALMATPKPAIVSIGNVDVSCMEMDPQDHNALYLGTVQGGLYYSYDGAESWHQALSMGKSQINSIAVSPENKCAIYASSFNKVYVSKDCNRTYKEIYHDPRATAVITRVKISKIAVYIGTSTGDLLKSSDGGETWTYIYNFKARIRDVLFKKDNSIIIVTTTGIYEKTGDKWEDLTESKEGQNFRDIKKAIYLDGAAGTDGLAVLTAKDIFISRNGGKSWEALKLITPSGKVTLYSMDINEKNPNEIIYSTATALVTSLDGGKSWTSAKSPSSRIPAALMIDQDKPDIIYLGMYKIQN